MIRQSKLLRKTAGPLMEPTLVGHDVDGIFLRCFKYTKIIIRHVAVPGPGEVAWLIALVQRTTMHILGIFFLATFVLFS